MGVRAARTIGRGCGGVVVDGHQAEANLALVQFYPRFEVGIWDRQHHRSIVLVERRWVLSAPGRNRSSSDIGRTLEFGGS